MGKALNLTNQQFGRLTALYKTESKNRKTYWHCKCQCGNECDVRTDSLTSGTIRSCGCYKKEVDREKILKIDNSIDLKNKQFGYLIPFEKTNKRINGHVVWKCHCQNCNNDCEVSSLYLSRGDTISCSCISRSNGEQKIYSLLKEHHIIFEEQKRFPNCIFLDSGYPARFDFYVDNRYLIEFNGIQHYDKSNPWYREGKDEFKYNWAKQNNIPLLEIKYDMIDNLSFEDIWIKREEK